MSWGPVTACAADTPSTCRSFCATSLALPGEVSIRMKAFTNIGASSHGFDVKPAHGFRRGAHKLDTTILHIWLPIPPCCPIWRRPAAVLGFPEHRIYRSRGQPYAQ